MLRLFFLSFDDPLLYTPFLSSACPFFSSILTVMIGPTHYRSERSLAISDRFRRAPAPFFVASVSPAEGGSFLSCFNPARLFRVRTLLSRPFLPLPHVHCVLILLRVPFSLVFPRRCFRIFLARSRPSISPSELLPSAYFNSWYEADAFFCRRFFLFAVVCFYVSITLLSWRCELQVVIVAFLARLITVHLYAALSP